MQRVFDAGLLLLHLNLGCRTDLDYGDPAGKLSNTLLHLFFIVIRGGFLDLDTDLIDPTFDIGLAAGTVDHGGVFLSDLHTFGTTQIIDTGSFEAHPDFFGDYLPTGQNCKILQHRFTAIAKPWRLDCTDLNDPANIVHDQSRQCFAINILSDNQQRPSGFGSRLKHRQHVPDI